LSTLLYDEFKLSVRWHDVNPLTHEKIDKFARILQGELPVLAHKVMGHIEDVLFIKAFRWFFGSGVR